MKTYQIKTYSKNGTFKKQINPKVITSQIVFTEELNGGQGNLNLSIMGSLDDYSVSDIVEIREVSDTDPTVTPTYTGIIEDIVVKEYFDHDMLDLSILGAFTVLNDAIYKEGGSRSFTKTGTPGQIVQAIIDSFNADYGTLSGGNNENLLTNIIRTTGSSIDLTGTSISRVFENDDCLESVKKTLENTGFDFWVDASGILYCQQASNAVVVNLTQDREINYIERTISKKDMVNILYLARNGGTVLTYNDASAITTYAKKEKFVSDTSIGDITTHNIQGNKQITDFKDPTNQIIIIIKVQRADFLSPGNKITTLNTKRQIVQKQITKIEKGAIAWKLYFGEFTSFGKSVLEG